MKKLVLLAPLFLLARGTSEQVRRPEGAPAYLVKYGNAVKSRCTEKAVDLCPRGYTELERKADRYDDLTKVGKLELKADTTTTMLIQCK